MRNQSPLLAEEDRLTELSVLYEISSIPTSLVDLDHIFDLVLDKATRLMSTEIAVLFVLSEDERDFLPRAARGVRKDKVGSLKAEPGQGGIGRALSEGKLVVLTNDQAELMAMDPLIGHYPIKSVLYAPIKTRAGVVGLLYGARLSRHAYTREEATLFTILADRAGMAIENARLYSEAQRRIRELSGLYEISQVFGTMTDIRETFGRLTRSCAQLIGAQVCVIAAYDETSREMRAQAPGYGVPNDLVRSFKYEVDGVPRDFWNFRTQGPMLVNDAVKLPSFFDQWIKGFHLDNFLIVPMILRDRITGLIYAGNKAGGFTEDDIKILTIFGNQAAVAVRNAQLYDELLKRLEKEEWIAKIAQQLSSQMSLATVLRETVKAAVKLIGGEAGTVALLDEDRGVITYPYSYNMPPEMDRVEVPRDSGLAGYVMKTGETVLLEDYPAHPASVPEFVDAGVKSLVGAPIIIGDKPLGAIGIFFLKGHRRFAEQDAALLCAVADQAAIAIDNARTYEKLKSLNQQIMEALAAAIESRDPYTSGHSLDVTRWAVAIGKKMGLSTQEIEELRLIGPLHDLGKIGIPDTILNKPSRLTSAEEILVKSHPIISADIVARIDALAHLVPIIGHHHENYDGTGYPDGLKGEEIPLAARILAVADGFEAMTSDRPYRLAKSREEAIEELKAGAGIRWDPKVIKAFLQVLEEEKSTVNKEPSL